MKLLKLWRQWRDKTRKENKLQCDLVLGPGDFIVIVSSDILYTPYTDKGKVTTIQPPSGKYTRVRLDASWKHCDTFLAARQERGDE